MLGRKKQMSGRGGGGGGATEKFLWNCINRVATGGIGAGNVRRPVTTVRNRVWDGGEGRKKANPFLGMGKAEGEFRRREILDGALLL